MAHRFNYDDSAQTEIIEHDTVLVNIDGRMVEITAEKEDKEDAT